MSPVVERLRGGLSRRVSQTQRLVEGHAGPCGDARGACKRSILLAGACGKFITNLPGPRRAEWEHRLCDRENTEEGRGKLRGKVQPPRESIMRADNY